MSEKYLIFGATGSIGSSLAEQLVNSGNSVHIVGRNENKTKSISEKRKNKMECYTNSNVFKF